MLAPQALRRHWGPLALIVIALIYTTVVTINHSPTLSPLDEWVYVDYLHKIVEQGMVHEGETVGDDALSTLGCHGTLTAPTVGPGCSKHYADASGFPNMGITSAAPYTPLYFGPTRFFGDIIYATTPLDLLNSWRLTGSLWLAAGLISLSALLKQWKASNLSVLSIGLLVVASPLSWWSFTFISTDATGLFFGATMLYLAVRYTRNLRHPWWLLLCGTLAVAFKVTNLIAVGLASLYIVVHFFVTIAKDPDAKRNWRVIWPALVTPLVGAGAQFGWLKFVAYTAVSTHSADQNIDIPLGIRELINQSLNFLPNVLTQNSMSPDFVIYNPLSWLIITFTLGSIMVAKKRDEALVPVASVALSAFIFAPVLAIALHAINGTYFELPARYGIGLVPGYLLLGSLLVRNRVVLFAFITYAAILLGHGITRAIQLGV